MNPIDKNPASKGANDRFSTGSMESLPDELKARLESARSILAGTAELMKGFFSLAEGAFLCDALRNAEYPLDRFDEWPLLLVWDIEDIEKHEKLGSRRYGIDISEMIEKMEDLTHEKALWLILAIDVFWQAREERGDQEEFYEVEL